jgi:hypothetical protein
MKKLVNVNRSPLIIDTDTFEITPMKETVRGIDSVYVTPEVAKLHWEQEDKDPIDIDVEKGDILLTFYNRDLGRNFLVVKSPEWLEMINTAEAIEQKRKEKWAQNNCCDCCDCCEEDTTSCVKVKD